MKAILIFPVLLSIHIAIDAQVTDDFSNGSLANNPTWLGDTADFFINEDLVLQLNAADGSESLIYTAVPAVPGDLQVLIDCRLEFNPSTSNTLRIYMWIDSPDPQIANGYFIELGSSGDEDKLQLFKLDDGESTLLGTGILEHAFAPAFQLEIQRKGPLWQVFTADPVNGSRTMEIESDLSPDRLSSGYFAIYCRYTVTRRDKFFFDNFFFIPEIPADNLPPSLIEIEVSTPRQLILEFSEPLDNLSASNTSYYRILPDIGNPILATLLADPTMVQLDLQEDLNPGDYHLEVHGVEDIEGHIATINFPFSYRPVIPVAPYDILINEIFDDPTPVVGLPEAEYIELFSNTDGVNLNQLQLQVGTRIVALPDRFLSKGEYIVLHNEKDSEKFASIPNAIGVNQLPALVNSGNNLKLLTKSGMIIHTISYNDNWYRETTKANGGWSLEMINPGDPCALAENWRASQSLSGGTPGMPNSVLNDGAPNITLQAFNISPIDSVTLLLSLNKSLLEIPAASNFVINPSISISWITVEGENQTNLIIKLESPLEKGINYKLIIDSLTDCSVNSFSRQSLTILIPEKIEPGDLLINEILFDPYPGGDDFLEIYNASSKALQLTDLRITNTITSHSVDIQRPFLMLPGTYAVICENARDLQSRYTVIRPEWVIENRLPSLNIDRGNITLFTAESGSAQIIDVFDYRKDMHHRLLKETKGVSLERINLHASGQNSSNWHSAARASGYATPTSVNSQYSSQNTGSLHWDVSPKILSPDGDGFDDYTLISYKQLDPGSYAHIKIYDAAGRLVRYLTNNESLATEGFIQWDGTTDRGTKAPIGIYSIFIQVFNLSGKVNEIKETCVVAARLN